MANPYLDSFIRNLNSNEIKIVEEHLRKIPSAVHTVNENKDFKLFRALLSTKENAISEKELSEITGSSGTALRVLKSRLFDKVSEALTHDSYIMDEKLFSNNERILFKVRKQYLLARILIRTSRKDNTEIIKELLKQIIDTAKEFELFDVVVDALIAKKYFIALRSGIKDFEKINKEIDFYNYCIRASYFACDSYYRLILNDDLIKFHSEKSLNKYIISSIKQMESDNKKIKSKQISFFKNYLAVILCERQKDYHSAIRFCNEQLNMVKNNKILYREDRIGNVLSNLSLFNIHIGDYDTALDLAKKVLKQFIYQSHGYVMTKKLEFHAYYYNANYTEAVAVVKELVSHPLADVGEVKKSIFVFYHACVLFRTKKYREALSILNEPLGLEKDKSRWNITLRIFIIMANIELARINEASQLIDSLRKHIERTGKKEEIIMRDLLIVKLLREIEKDSFMYDSKNMAANKLLKMLSEKNKVHSWEHFSPELIPFHEWLLTKKK